MRIPTTQELADQYLATLESSISQTSPLNNKAFLRVLAVLLAMLATGLYKFGTERSKQNLALTATAEDLDLNGESAPGGVFRKPAEYAALTLTIPAPTGVTVPITASFISPAGLTYSPTAAAIAAMDVATVPVVCDTAGVAGNLQAGDKLTLVSPVPGVGSTATVLQVDNVGAEEETDDALRQRVLFALRTTRGGGNAADYKAWAEGVAGVTRAFPYAGKPVSLGQTSYPADRCVFVQSDTTINADGVPTQALLDEVTAALCYDPDTGAARPGLGLTDDTLWVKPIARKVVNVTINNLSCTNAVEADVRAAVNAALASVLLTYAPYIDGVDLPQDRNDKVTAPSLSGVMQDVLNLSGSSATGLAFTVAGTGYTSYQMGQGELLKLGTVTYATV